MSEYLQEFDSKPDNKSKQAKFMQETLIIKIALTMIIIGLPILVFISDQLPEIPEQNNCQYENRASEFSEFPE